MVTSHGKHFLSFMVSLFFYPVFAALAQQAYLPFSIMVSERTENLPTYVTPHLPNLYNATPNFRVGWGIDYPIGTVVIDDETWVMFNSGNQYGTHVKVARFRGSDFEHTNREADGAIDVEHDVSTHFLGGMWYDNRAKKLYAPIHCEYKRDITPQAGWSRKKTRLATSTDKGLSWKMEGDILTDCLPGDDEWLKYSGSFFQAGPADFDFYADSAGGFFYIFSSNAYAPKSGVMNNYLWFNEVARCAIRDTMAPGKWYKFRNGTWTEPGLGGKSSGVSMDSYGIYGRVIYSTYLRKYLRIGPCMGVADKRYTSTGFADHSIYMSTCDDLARQEWSPKVKLFDKPENDKLGITLTDEKLRNPFICGRALTIYNYWLYNLPSRAIDVAFAAGSTAAAGFPRHGSYAYEPLPESGDSIVSRRTRIVGCTHPDIRYTGSAWTITKDPRYYREMVRVSNTPGSGIQFSFRGADIYWRAVADSDGGKADVLIDGNLVETVDCYHKEPLPYQFAFMKRGLDAKQTHRIRIVIRHDANPLSRGTAIRHMAFEHAAESYNAAAGFSSVAGKNNWWYQKGDGKSYSVLDFHYADTLSTGNDKSGKVRYVYPNYWGRKGIAVVGNDYQIPGGMEAVRTFIAPRTGDIRIEGEATLDNDSSGTCTVKILKNDGIPLLGKTVTFAHPAAHDLTIPVKKGDAVHFVAGKNDREKEVKVIWDPTITFPE